MTDNGFSGRPTIAGIDGPEFSKDSGRSEWQEAAQHLHGGLGADVDYPVHCYFWWGRQIALSLGGADGLAAELGDLLETTPANGGAA